MKRILINYRFISGEHDIDSHTITTAKEFSDDREIEQEIHDHMMCFWGSDADYDATTYNYFAGSIAIKVLNWHVLDATHFAALRDLKLSRGL